MHVPISRHRGTLFVASALLWSASAAMPGALTPARADMWVCKQADGTEIYSNRKLGHACRVVPNLPPLLRAPAVPQGPRGNNTLPDAPAASDETARERREMPIAGRGRSIDPPADEAITIRDVKAVPNFSSLLGIANYQASMRLTNEDGDWTGEQVCVDVRFRDATTTFLDVHQVGCLEGLKPGEDRPFTVTYTGTIPPRLFPIEADVQLKIVKWTR